MRTYIVGWVESLSVAGTKRAIVNRAANLEQEIGPLSPLAHLLRFIHSAVHQEIGHPSLIAVPTLNPARWRSA